MPLENGNNTRLVPDNMQLKYLEAYTYACLTGYITDKEMTTVCLPDGTLSLASPPRCERKLALEFYSSISIKNS